MGERFYLAQIEAIGTCPGINPNKKRKRKMAWTDEQKDIAKTLYLAGNPTPENSMEIVKSVAEEMDESVNGVRMILTKADVYVKKAAATKSDTKSSTTTRVSKDDAQESLRAAITDVGGTVDEDIITKLTGKAAIYFAGVIKGVTA